MYISQNHFFVTHEILLLYRRNLIIVKFLVKFAILLYELSL